MSDSRAYYMSSSSRSSRHDADGHKQDQRLPSLQSVVGGALGTPSPYNFHDVASSLPHYPSHDKRDHSTKPSHYNYPQPTSNSGTYSAYSNSTQPPARQSSHTIPTYGSSRSNAKYPSNNGHTFQAFYGNNLVPVTPESTVPQGLVRACDIPDEGDPKKKYKCRECGKGFDRPSSLETHTHRHTGDKPHPCPAPGCDKSFSVRSNMIRHFRKLHEGQEGEEDDDRRPNHQATYSVTSHDSSPPSRGFYSSSSCRR